MKFGRLNQLIHFKPFRMLSRVAFLCIGMLHILAPAETNVRSKPHHIFSSCEEQLAAQIIAGGNYNDLRGWEEYSNRFGSRFDIDIEGLGPGHHILEMGAGVGRFMYDLARRYGSSTPFLSAVSFDPKYWEPDHLASSLTVRSFLDRYFEEISDQEIKGNVGAADVIIDYFGVLAYSPHIDQVLKRYWQLLKPGGRIYTVTSAFSRTTFSHDFRPSDYTEYLKALTGFKYAPYRNERDQRVVLLTKSADAQEPGVPALFLSDLRRDSAGSGHPYRHYLWDQDEH